METNAMTPDHVIAVCAEAFGVPVDQIRSLRRRPTMARSLACVCLTDCCGMSVAEAGEALGYPEHSCIVRGRARWRLWCFDGKNWPITSSQTVADIERDVRAALLGDAA